MDVLTFLQKGNVSANPNYNPKTKKGAIQPPFIVNYNPGQNTSDIGRNNITKSSVPTIYDLNKFQDQQYYEHDVIPNYFDTEEQLQKERAENQTAIEQFGRFATQVVGSEIILGTLRGFSDLADAGITLVQNARAAINGEEGPDNDYTNAVSEQLAQWQDDIRKRFEIYETDPNASFNFRDLGWILNGATSIASTLSLAIPGTAISKLGKLARLNKVAKSVGKTIGYTVGKPRLFGEIAEIGGKQLSEAALMRTAENYIEARDTYTSVYDEVNNRLNAMTPSQKEKFFEDNPQFADKTNEEIAKYIAGESADDVFRNDFGLMLLDMWQLRSLKNVWHGARSVRPTSELLRENKNFARRLVGEAIENPTKAARIAKYANLNSLSTIGAELSEGFEEAYQYYTQQNATDNAIRLIDENHKVRTLNDYLSDPEMWENAFWGWIGGVAFQGIAGTTGRAWNKYITKAKDSTIEARKANINGRANALQNFVNRMELLNNNLDPDRRLTDANGDIITGENAGYESIDDITRDVKKKTEIEALVTKMTIEAAKTGNYDLLKDFFTSSEFNKYLSNTNVLNESETKSFIDGIGNKMDRVYEEYSKQLNKIYKNDVSSPSIAMAMAEENTISQIVLDEELNAIAGYQDRINESVNSYKDEDTRNNIAALETDLTLAGYEREVVYTKKAINELDERLKKKEISKIEHAYRREQLLKLQDKFVKAAGYNNLSEFESDLKNHRTYDEVKNALEGIDRNLFNNLLGKSLAERRKIMAENNINDTKQKIADRAKYIENSFKYIQDESLQNSFDELNNIFDTNNIDDVEDYIIYKSKDNPLSDEVKSKLDRITRSINVLSPADENLAKIIGDAAQEARKKKKNKPTATVNGNGTNVVPEAATNAPSEPAMDNSDNGSTDAGNSSSTGGQPVGTVDSSNTGNNDTSSARPEGLAGSSPVEDGSTADDAIQSVIQQQQQAEEAYFNATKIIDDYALNQLLKDRNHDFDNLNENDIYERLKNDLVSQGVEEDLIRQELPKQIKSLNMIYSAVNNAANNEDLPFSALTVEVGRVITADEERKANAVKDLINKYVEITHGLEYNDNGTTKYAISIRSLMKYIKDNIGNKQDISFTVIKEAYDNVVDVLSQDIDGVQVLDRNNLRLDDFQLSQIIDAPIEQEDRRSKNVNVTGLNREEKSFVGSLPVGSVIEASVAQYKNGGRGRGVDFYYTDSKGFKHKVGFNFLPTRTPDNSGFQFYSSVYGVRYTINKTGDGEIICDLDPIFNELNPASTDSLGNPINPTLSKDARELLDIMLSLKSNPLLLASGDESFTDKVINFAKTNLGKQLLNISNDSNVNYNNIMKCVNYINSIYFYNNTDNYDANFQSYVQWTTGQYNNFEMTESIYNAVINGDTVNIDIDYVTKGTVVAAPDGVGPQTPHLALANYNSRDYHLGIVPQDGYIEDANTGSVISASSRMNRRALSVIIPNGSNAPTYLSLIANNIDVTSGLGLKIKNELTTILNDFIDKNITYDVVLKKLNSIFGVRKLINGINVGEHNNKIVIYRNGDKSPILTLYKFDANGNENNGISINNVPFGGQLISFNNKISNFDEQVNNILNNLLKSGQFSMSYDFAKRLAPNNEYINFDNNRMTAFGIIYDNYLDFIDKNNLATINTSYITIDGRQTNFVADNNMQLKINYNIVPKATAENNVEQKRIDYINEERNKGDHEITSAIEFLSQVAPSYSISNEAIEVILPKSFEIRTSDTRPIDGAFDVKTNTIFVTNRFLDKISNSTSGQRNALRVLMHEQIHRQLAKHNILNNERFYNELAAIRDAFANHVNGEIPQSLLDYAKAMNYKVDDYIKELRKFVDYTSDVYNGKSEEYLLEEFIVEALTDPYLSQALNHIETIGTIENNAKPNLWTRIINWIREVFNLGDVNNNTLLNDIYMSFANNFESNNPNIENNSTSSEDEQGGSPVESGSRTADDVDVEFTDEDIDSNSDMFDDIGYDEDMFSALDVAGNGIALNSVSSVASQLTAGEAAQFATSVAQGELNYRCY